MSKLIEDTTQAAMSEGGPADLGESWNSALSSVPAARLGELARVVNENRLTLPAYRLLGEGGSPNARSLRNSLEPAVRQLRQAEADRDRQLKRLVDVLAGKGISYVVFKTFNRTGWVGVDIDVMIGKADYQTCVDSLLAAGYYSIDDLSKQYATGFMSKGNPIIVDLHTQLAVLGVSYFSSDVLLSDVREARVDVPGEGCLEFSRLGPRTEAVVRMAHAVIKEGIVTGGEIAEVLPDVGLDGVSELIGHENLQLAGSVFGYAADGAMGGNGFDRVVAFNDSALHALAKGMLDETLRRRSLPSRIPSNVSVLSLIDRLQAEGALSISLPTLMRNITFRRNAAYIGHTLLERLGIS